MTPLNEPTIPTLYDHWTSFCNNPPDQIVYKEQTLIVGSGCKTVIHCPRNFSNTLTNLVVYGDATLTPDGTSQSYEFHVTNIYVLGGKLESHGVTVVANRIIQLTRPQFERALSTLFVQSNVFKPIDPRTKETPTSRFYINVFQIKTETPLEKFHAYKGLRTAAKNGEEEYVKLFIAAKANINEGSQTPLILAAERNHVEVVDLLIKANASLEKEDLTGSTPLIRAATNNAVKAAQLLLAAKANVNTANFGDQTPLNAAVDSSSLEMLNLLHDAGADLNTTLADENSMSAAIMHAVGNGLVQKLSDLLAQGFNIEVTNGNNDTPLTIAAKYGQDQIVALLLANSANTEARGNQGTALDLAVFHNFPKIIQLLIAEDPDAAIKFLMTHSHPESMIKMFFQLVPNATAFGRQALKEAVRTSNAKAVWALLAAGVGVSGDPSNQEEKVFGEEILLCAVFSANFEIVQLLIQAKANFHIVDSQGSTLLMQVRLLESGLSLPQNEKVDSRPARFHTRSAGYKKIIDLLIAAGAKDELEVSTGKEKSLVKQKPPKPVQFATILTSTESIEFPDLASAQNNIDAFMALIELNMSMIERNYGCTCTERLVLINTIKNNKKININDPSVSSAVSILKRTNKILPKKDQPRSGQRKKPAIQEQKDYS